MLSLLYYIFLVVLCTVFMVLSAVALLVCWPFDKARRVVHRLTCVMVRIFFTIPPCWQRRVVGRENVDPKGSYVVVVNHRSMIDIPSVYTLPLNFRWVSKREVFRIPFFGQFLLLHGDICIDRGHASQAMEQLIRDGKLWLSRGASVAIFPEGTRSKDGEIHRFKAGAFNLAKEAGVAILPVVLEGTDRLIHPNRLFSWRNRITVRILPPVSAAMVAETDTHTLIEQVHEQMCQALSELRDENSKSASKKLF
ncbi:MAG: 1-acylglycerol-3-phosphate O-acyltransferase [Alistipes sp.]